MYYLCEYLNSIRYQKRALKKMNKILRGNFFARLFVLYHWVTFNVREFYLARATSNNF